MRLRIRDRVSGIVPIILASWALEMVQLEGFRPLLFVAEIEQVRGQAGGNLLEGDIFDLDRKLPQAVGQNGQHVERQGRAGLNEIHERPARKKTAGGSS